MIYLECAAMGGFLTPWFYFWIRGSKIAAYVTGIPSSIVFMWAFQFENPWGVSEIWMNITGVMMVLSWIPWGIRSHLQSRYVAGPFGGRYTMIQAIAAVARIYVGR